MSFLSMLQKAQWAKVDHRSRPRLVGRFFDPIIPRKIFFFFVFSRKVKNNQGHIMEKEEAEENTKSRNQNKKVVIQIPSYQEVIETSSQPKSQSLFKPSQSFSQAFSFIKNSEFYTPPPPPPPPPATSSSSSQSQNFSHNDAASR